MEKETFELYISQSNFLQVEICKDYGLMLNFVVKTNGFVGHGPIYFEKKDINDAINKLSDMTKSLNGDLVLRDIESTDYFVKFMFEGSELFIEGNIGDYTSNRLHFLFKADQTVLTLLLAVLNKMKYKLY